MEEIAETLLQADLPIPSSATGRDIES
jgi:hypothetical protein